MCRTSHQRSGLESGLDRSHHQPVADLEVITTTGRVVIHVRCSAEAELEQWEADQRRGLLEEALGMPVEVVMDAQPSLPLSGLV